MRPNFTTSMISGLISASGSASKRQTPTATSLT
jgi:hypothetical protein